MDFQARITLDLEAPDRRIVERAPGVVFVATANLGAEYVGTELLDAALLDRLKYIRLGYPDAEERILMALGLPKRKAKQMTLMAKAIREQHSRGVLNASISTRGLVEAGELVGAGFPLPDVFEAVVPAFSEEAIAALRTTVRAQL
jgi:nitric oxide reductase NorQ protein